MRPLERWLKFASAESSKQLKQQDHTDFSPGSKFRYCNAGYVLLALIVEQVSGGSFPDFLSKNIFKPLGMNHTRFYAREDFRDRNRAYGYSKKEKGFERSDQSQTSSILGDGSLYSSVEDLYKWHQALYTSRLVSKELLKQAFTAGVSLYEKERSRLKRNWLRSERRRNSPATRSRRSNMKLAHTDH